MIHYLVAKYIDDLARNEPTNIGVVVYDGARALARFDGEDDAGKIDLRRVRNRITGSYTYRAWVEYWRRGLDDPGALGLGDAHAGDPDTIERLLAIPARDFFLERGGTILLDEDERDLRATLDDLFARLVRAPDPLAPPTLREKSREALASAGAPLDDETRFKEDVTVRLNVAGVTVEEEVNYAVMNGDWHYVQMMPFDPARPRISRKEASHCVFVFEHASWAEGQGLIVYDGSDIAVGSYELLGMLKQFAPIVDVREPEEAASALRQHLSL